MITLEELDHLDKKLKNRWKPEMKKRAFELASVWFNVENRNGKMLADCLAQEITSFVEKEVEILDNSVDIL